MRSESKHRRSRARTVLCTVGWLLPLALGCRLTDADEVDRRPNAIRGSGGTDGRDHPTLGEGGPDSRADAPVAPDVALPPEQDATLDMRRDDASGGIDGSATIIDTGDVANTVPQSTEDESESCDDHERDARAGGR